MQVILDGVGVYDQYWVVVLSVAIFRTITQATSYCMYLKNDILHHVTVFGKLVKSGKETVI
jgi:hypothetical protein